MEEELIEFVRNNSFLYNKKSKNYRNAVLRDQKYNELAKKINVPARRLKDRWRTLKDKFYKEVKRQPPCNGIHSAVRKWKWMDQLSFLKETHSENENTSGKFDIDEVSLGDSIDDKLEEIYSESLEENSQPLTSARRISSQQSSPSPTTSRKINDLIAMDYKAELIGMTQIPKSILRESSRPIVKSTIQLFCDGLASQIEGAALSQFQFSNLQIALLRTFQDFLPKD